MKNWDEIVWKIVELLEQQNTPIPEFNITDDIGRSRLILYFNKHRTEENLEKLKTFLYE